ncbi:MAG: DUF2147 domain-containing protein [Flavobacteriaceae bacterium]|nr:DUF2147 domain-containing protein [Flavobacteriaceae bacterium]
MKNLLIVLIVTLSGIISISAQSVTGKWYTIDPDTNEKETIIEVYQENNKVYAKIIQLLQDEDQGKVCDKCTGKDKDQPIEGMVILKGLEKDDDEWSGGQILDPKNGSYYKCYITLVEKNKLKIRGFIGFSLLGRTEYWYRHID